MAGSMPWYQQPAPPLKAPQMPPQAQPGAPTPQQVLNQGGSWSPGYDNKGATDPTPSTATTYSIPPGGAAAGALKGLTNGFASGAQASATGATGVTGAPQAPAFSPYTPPSQNPLPAAPVAPVQRPNMPAQVNVGQGGPSSDMLKANNDAIYANAKDEAANTARAALTGLQGELQARGMGGAGYEAGQISQTLSREADTIGQASRQNAQTQYDQSLVRANNADSLNVSQRGQDLGALESLYSTDVGAGVATRGQDLSASTSKYGTDTSAASAARGQDLSKYGIDVSSANQAAQRAQQQQLALLGLVKGLY